MILYSFLARHLPHSYLAKLFAAVAAGFAMPLAGLAIYGFGRGWGAIDPAIVAVLLAASSAGLVLACLAIRALLDPVLLVAGVLDRWGRTGQIEVLPEHYRDEIGLLMARTNRMMARAQRSLDQSRREQDTDPLTGALNRRGAERLLRDAPAGWLLLLDLDRFAALNEACGTAEGDRVLREATQVCANALRQDDILARIAGDEFVVFLPGAPREVAARIAERLGREIREKVALKGPVPNGLVGPSLSIGMAAHPGGEAIDAAMEAAGRALARAKEEGRDRTCGAPAHDERAA